MTNFATAHRGLFVMFSLLASLSACGGGGGGNNGTLTLGQDDAPALEGSDVG